MVKYFNLLMKTSLLKIWLIFNFSLICLQSQANSNLDSLKSVIENKSFSDSIRIVALKKIGFEFLEYSPDSTIAYLDKAMSLAQKKGIQSLIADTYDNKGWALITKGKYKPAIEELKKSLHVADQLHDERILASAYTNLGTAYLYLDYNKTALECYEKGLEFSKRINKLKMQSIVLLNIAIIYLDLGNHEKALKHFSEAEEILKKFPKRTKAYLYYNMGLAYEDKNDLDQAFYYFDSALKEAISANNLYLSGVVHSNLADFYIQVEKFI